jgi:hypothetical protein
MMQRIYSDKSSLIKLWLNYKNILNVVDENNATNTVYLLGSVLT